MARGWIRLSVAIIILAVTCGTAPAVASAQTFTFEAVTPAGAPLSEVEIFIIGQADSPKSQLGKTNTAGACDVPLATFTKLNAPAAIGTSYRAYRRVCADGKIQVILVAPGVTATKDQLGCGDQDAVAGKPCECDDMGIVVLRGTTRLTVPAQAAAAMSSMGGGRLFRITSLHVMGGVKFVSFASGSKPCATIERQLLDLGYNENTGGCITDSSGLGFVGGGGVTLDLGGGIPVDLWLGAQFERLGEESHSIANARRINVPNRPSNLIFSMDSTTVEQLFNIEVGAAVTVGRATIVPYIAISRAKIETTVNSTLLGGAPGPVVPTMQLAGATNETSKAKWGPGFGARVLVPLTGRVGVLLQAQARPFPDAFAVENESRHPTNFNSTGVAVGLCVGFGAGHR